MAEWKFPVFGHGGDYNPDQWLDHPEVLAEDIRLMKLSHCNIMSVGIFAWAALEPEEGVYTFDWLESVINNLYENGISVLLATPSGARPAWLSKRYPEVLRVNPNGIRNGHFARHNHCFTSSAYRMKVREINTKLAERFGKHPGVVGWHISNEYSGECHCELCKNAFREFLKREYGTLDNLNHCWWTSFWSHKYTDWNQIDPPSELGETSVHGLTLAWKRFITDQTVDFMREEIAPIRRICPDKPVTANFMTRFDGLDYSKFLNVIDFASWDSYPLWGENPVSDYETALSTALYHDYIRCLLDKPFVLMESTPSMTNWQQVSKLKRPGIHLLSGMLAVAQGADSVQYFQWRKGLGGSEKFHGAVVDHTGSENTRVFRDVTAMGQYLLDIKPVLGANTRADAAVIYDTENRWALEMACGVRKDKQHDGMVNDHYFALKSLGLNVDVIDSEHSFEGYKLIVAPMLYMLKEGVAERLTKFVENGGELVTTVMTGIADRNDLCFTTGMPGPLRKLLGIYIEETDGLWDEERNSFKAVDNDMGIEGEYACRLMCDLIHAETAKPVMVYGSDFYQGMPAMTVNAFGSGKAWHIASRVDPALLEKFYLKRAEALSMKRLSSAIDKGIVASSRVGADGSEYLFFMNFDSAKRAFAAPEGCKDLLTGEAVSGTVELDGRSGITLVR